MDKQLCQCYCGSLPSSPHQQQCYQLNFMEEPNCKKNNGCNCYKRSRPPQLRSMQATLISKWKELEALGHAAENCCMYRRALQQRLANESAQMALLKHQSPTEREYRCPEAGMLEPYNQTNQLQMRNNFPDHRNTFTGALKRYEPIAEETQACICKNARNSTNYRCAPDNLASTYDHNYRGEAGYQPFICNDTRNGQQPVLRENGLGERCICDHGRGNENPYQELEIKHLREGVESAVSNERDIREHLTKLRCEIGCLESKIKALWGSNVVDLCTPAAVNRTKFF